VYDCVRMKVAIGNGICEEIVIRQILSFVSAMWYKPVVLQSITYKFYCKNIQNYNLTCCRVTWFLTLGKATDTECLEEVLRKIREQKRKEVKRGWTFHSKSIYYL
jgi:hypothetical protein